MCAAVAAGIKVALAARSSDKLERIVSELGPDNALAIECDMTDLEALRKMIDTIVGQFGPLDVVFANELVPHGIRVTSIDPGMIEDPFFDKPQPQALRPEDIAKAFLYTVEAPTHAGIAEIEVNPMIGAHSA